MAEAVLVLEDGRTFHGEAYGAVGETIGEAVFSTGMTGYQETLTDPSYHRQVVVMTSPHVGNTGIHDDELTAQGVVGISGIDTRALTRHLRERGAMRVGIASNGSPAERLLDRVRAAPQMAGAALAADVSTSQPYVVPAV